MAVLARPVVGRMGVIVVLGVGLGIVDVALRVVVPLEELVLGL